MSTNYLIEAFKELELLDTVDTNKENKLTGTFEFDKKGVEDLGKFMEDDTFNDFETVIDPEATTEEELQDSYIGMGILGCDICHSMIYKPMEEIVIDEETQMANVGECCPYCYERDGFKIIGKVAPFEDISVEVEKTEDGEEVPEPTVKVNGKDVPVDEAPAKEEEALTAEQKYPIKSPVSVKGLKEGYQFKSSPTPTAYYYARGFGIIHQIKTYAKESEKTLKEISEYDKIDSVDTDILLFDLGSDALDNQNNIINAYEEYFKEGKEIYLVTGYAKEDFNERIQDKFNWVKIGERPISENINKKIVSKRRVQESTNSEKLFSTFPDLEDAGSETPVATTKPTKPAKQKPTKIRKGSNVDKLFTTFPDLKENKIEEELSNSEKLFRAFPELREPIKESINEGMEDISITTDDQVIKVKATPREDKETIVPVEPKEIEAVQPVEETTPVAGEETPVDGEDELMDIELDEIDETSFDELGESYLKKVYENVNSFKTISGLLTEDNKLKLEGVIEFNSGKKAKTAFLFEAKEITRKGQLKFVGLNENLSKNKKAFTLAGSTKDGKLVCEQLNYNYLAKDEKSGVSKRLYGTIRK